MPVSREIDLTQDLIFNKPHTHHIYSSNIKTPKRDPYKRYREVNPYFQIDLSDTTSQYLSTWDISSTSTNTYTLSPQFWEYQSNIINSQIQFTLSHHTSTQLELDTQYTYTPTPYKQEERICWRSTLPETFHIIYSEEDFSHTPAFPMGTKQQRAKYIHPQLNTCECCRCSNQSP